MSKLNHTITGNGSTVILIHGLFGNLDNLKALGTSLIDHTIIRLDVPNHGLSPHCSNMNYQSIADAVIQLMDELAIDAAHIVGHSMGGKIAMAVALCYPNRVKSLIAADIAPVNYSPRHQNVFAALDQLNLTQITGRADALKQLINSGIDEATAQFLLKNLSKTSAGYHWKMNLDGIKQDYDALIGWDITDKQYKGPALCIRGADSDYVLAAHRQSYLNQFPNVQAKTIAATGHWLHAQKPAVFNRIVGEFIAEYDSNLSNLTT
ncbi:alpha/beta fold hydrolase [Shewanella colwelliana]|uniref:alpha/beta fold hydrolase n=1 Tax=Shewanella colwelliana TaxID=23 RepID=UPI00373597D2